MFRSLFLHKLAFKPGPDITSRTWWHGTDKNSARKIRNYGISAQQISNEGGQLAPQENRSYFASSLKLALSYAYMRARDKHDLESGLFIFEIPGIVLNDLTLDEDSLADLYLYYYGLDPTDSTKLVNPSSLAMKTWVKSHDHISRNVVKILESKVPEIKALSKEKNIAEDPWLYDELVSLCKDAIAREVIPHFLVLSIIQSLPASITSDGVIWPSKMYKIPYHEELDIIDEDSITMYWDRYKNEIEVIDL